MTTPLTITSLSQGILNPKPESDADYWRRFQDAPKTAVTPLIGGFAVAWPRWPFRRNADQT